jgi:hypothetical protein
MKNQNDLVISIASAVVALAAILFFAFTQPSAQAPAPPTTVDTSDPKLPAGDVSYADSLPGASASAGGMTGGRGGMGMGGRGMGPRIGGMAGGPPGMGGMGGPPGMGGMGGPPGMGGMGGPPGMGGMGGPPGMAGAGGPGK